MTIDTAKELQMNIAKEGLALLVLHPTADVQLHRECISHIGTAWDIWDLFETTLRADSAYARTCLFEMAKWLEESQNLLDWIEKTPAEKQAWMEQVS